MLDVNVVGAFVVARAALRGPQRPGAIVFNASVNALRPELHFLDYNASKAAIVSMAKSLALEVSATGTTVTALCPGYFPTRMTAPYLEDPATRDDLAAHPGPSFRHADRDRRPGRVLAQPPGGVHDRQRCEHRRRRQHSSSLQDGTRRAKLTGDEIVPPTKFTRREGAF